MRLIDAVRGAADGIIARKEREHIEPAAALYTEIQIALKADVVETMRDLIRSGEYIGRVTVNGIPMLLRNNNSQQQTNKQR